VSAFQLTQEIVRLSNANAWDEARFEWGLEEVRLQDEPSTCLCGYFPIKEICVIRNRVNGARTEVGNVCVTKFLGLPSSKIFAALGRVARGCRLVMLAL
jgi:hypothetical protein